MSQMSNLGRFLSRPAQNLTLTRMQRLYDQFLGSTGPAYQIVHIAGTNGKGSVAGKLHSCLSGCGYRVGMYTSPHIWSVHDRITINWQPIPDQLLQAYLGDVLRSPVENVTTFEALTLSALRFFQDNQVDYAIVEVGLGGTLDATNVLTPSLSIITSIALDHTEYLGDSIDDITRHKAGIIKSGVPVVIGPTVPERIITPIATQLQAPVHQVQYNDLMKSSYESENRAIAARSLQVLNIPYNDQDLDYTPPCRFQTLTQNGINIVLDAAHNRAALNRLCDRLQEKKDVLVPGRNLHIVLGMGRDKMSPGDAVQIFNRISPSSISIVSAKDNTRAWKASEFVSKVTNNQLVQCLHDGDIQRTIAHLLGSCQSNDAVVICGSFYIMREAQEALGIQSKVPVSSDEMGALHDRCISPQQHSR